MGWNIVKGYANSVRDSDGQPSNVSYNLTYVVVLNHFGDVCSHHTRATQKCFMSVLDTIRHSEASQEETVKQARVQLNCFLDKLMVSRLCSPLSIK
jgi:hypothetical protein